MTQIFFLDQDIQLIERQSHIALQASYEMGMIDCLREVVDYEPRELSEESDEETGE